MENWEQNRQMPDRKRSLPLWRYVRLYGSFLRYCLVREMSFHVNFLVRCVTSAFWMVLLVMFFQLIFLNTKSIGDWNKYEYLFFMGTGFILNGLMDALFLDNCSNMSELIRTGNLDFALIKPVDEQFLLSCQRIDLSAIPNLVVGITLLIYASYHASVDITPLRVLNYVTLIAAGLAIMYSLLISMAASSIWMIRNRGLYEVWFYVTQFSRYPAEIYRGGMLGIALHFTLMFVLPILLAVNIPARYGIHKLEDNWLVAYLLVAAALMLLCSRSFFRFALKHYQSASS